MKKYSLMIIGVLFLLAGNAYAQAPRIYSDPAAFDVNEDITIYMDVTGTPLAGETGTMCFWSWSNIGVNVNNGDWGSFNIIMNKVDGKDNLYSVKVNMAKDYPAGSTQIQGLVVKQDESAQTADSDALLPYNFNRVGASKAVIYPTAFNATTPVSIVININGSAIDLDTDAVHIHAGLNGWDKTVAFDSDLNKTAMSKVEGYEGIWRKNFVISEYFDVPENERINNLMAVFNNGSWKQQMKDGEEDFAFVPVIGGAVTGARFFLSQFRTDDVLPIIVNTTGLEEDDPLSGYNGDNMVFVVTLSDNDGNEETKRIAARKTADNTYMLVILPATQFDNGSGATEIEVTISAGALTSATTLTGSFIN